MPCIVSEMSADSPTNGTISLDIWASNMIHISILRYKNLFTFIVD